jgi:hypothetical protein
VDSLAKVLLSRHPRLSVFIEPDVVKLTLQDVGSPSPVEQSAGNDGVCGLLAFGYNSVDHLFEGMSALVTVCSQM